jgi:peptidyl-prolyl cis-trans isomerase D
MLQSIREKTSGWIAYVIIGLISIPFALWGINSYLGGGEQKPAAIVDGKEISARQLDYAYARYRERLASVFGGNMPSMFNDEKMLKEQVLTQIIEEQVLLNHIQQSGFRVGDEKLFEQIQAMPVFQQDGKFNRELYVNQLASQGYQPAMFEQELRRESEMQQLNQAISVTAFTVPAELDRYNRLLNQSRKTRSLTIQNTADQVQVSDQQISDYYNERSGLYMDPAMVKVDYIELSLGAVKQSIDVNEEQLRQRYEQTLDHLTTPEIRTASHILLAVKEGDDEEKVKQQILDLKNRINQGESFADLAREYSQDPGSAAEGGDLGEVESGMMVKPFESVLFSLTPGEVSDPVKTQFGWHLIKLRDVTGGQTKSFEEAKPELEQELKTEMAESRIYDLSENLANIGYEQPDSLLPASEQLGLKIQTSDWFSRSQGTGIAENEKVRQLAFSEDVLNQNRNSDTIDLGDNHIVMMHLNAQKAAQRKPLDAVREDIIKALKNKQGRAQAETKGNDLLTQLRSGSPLDTVAQSEGIKVVDNGFVRRDSSAMDRDVLNALFSMPKPEGSAVYEGITEVDGDYTIIELTQIKVDEPTDGNKEAVASETKDLNEASARYEYQALVKTMTEQADITRTPVSELE